MSLHAYLLSDYPACNELKERDVVAGPVPINEQEHGKGNAEIWFRCVCDRRECVSFVVTDDTGHIVLSGIKPLRVTPNGGDIVVNIDLRRLFPKWDGQGLPPVGVTCETWSGGVKRTVTILCYGELNVFVRQDDGRELLLGIREGREFRPILTPEQIAAQERKDAICAMAHAIVADSEKSNRRQSCAACTQQAAEALYDAGYRKVEGGKP